MLRGRLIFSERKAESFGELLEMAGEFPLPLSGLNSDQIRPLLQVAQYFFYVATSLSNEA